MLSIPIVRDALRTAAVSALMCSTCLALPEFQKLHVFTATSPSSYKGRLLRGSSGKFYGTSNSGGSHGKGTVYTVNSVGEVGIVASFNGSNGSAPYGGLVVGTDGDYYGTTSDGGIGTSVVVNGAGTFHYGGTVFRLTPDGEITTLANFTGPNGLTPVAELVIGPDGNFYGTTQRGGNAMAGTELGKGTVFRLTPGGNLSTLVNFNGNNGATPGPLIVGRDGNLYGVTSSGGNSNSGTIFRMQPSGAFTTLVHFNGTNGGVPLGLVYGADGNFYGTTNSGGGNYYGTFFRMTSSGAFTTLASFNSTTGRNPTSPLTLLPDGSFMGASRDGIFKVTPAGSITHLASLNETNGMGCHGLVPGWDGELYGATESGGSAGVGTVFNVTPAGEFTVLANFHNPDGVSPRAGLATGPYNRLYGTTEFGGIANQGTIFSITPSGGFETLMSFDGRNGMFPYAELTPGPDGSLYGSTLGSQTTTVTYPEDFQVFGSIFKITPSIPLEFSSLVRFDKSNGALPADGLTLGGDGNIYGTTGGGPWVNHSGSFFRMTPEGDLTTLIQFDYSTSGRFPTGKLATDAEGNFYGCTRDGGSSQYGTVFKVDPAGNRTTLINFNGNNGRNPQGVVADSSGNLYGTTGADSSSASHGTVFKITKSGIFSTLLTFNNISHGSHPGRLTLGPDGNFYGAACYGGSSSSTGQAGSGTVFRISPAGAFTILHNFEGTDGRAPNDALVFGPDGHLYGTTLYGGVSTEGADVGQGSIYRMHFGPEVTTQPPSAPYLPDVTLNAMIDPRGYDTTVSFQIGTDPWMNNVSTVSAGVVPAGSSSSTVQAVASNLLPDTGYYFRVVASNAENPVLQLGETMYFSTQAVLVVEDPAGNEIANGSKPLSFGTVTRGKSEDRFITLGNGSEGVALTSVDVAIEGPDASSFSIVSMPPASMAPGDSETIALRFSPGTSGKKSALLTIHSNDPYRNPFEMQLIGTGTEPIPEIAIQQPLGSNLADGTAKKSFGTVKIGKSGAAKIFTIRNTGTGTLGKLTLSKDGKHRDDFIVGPLAKTSLAPGASVTFKVTFKPSVKGTRNAAIHIKSNDADENPFDIKLTGMGSGS